MTNDTTLFEKIEDWLSGELPEAEARAFEDEIAADPALAREVERHRRGREALDRLAEQGLQSDFARWRESLDDIPSAPPEALPVSEKLTGKISGSWRWLLRAAALLVLAGAVWFLTRQPRQGENGNDTVKETKPTQQKPDAPVADITPSTRPATESPPAPDKPQLPRKPDSRKLIAMADTRLDNFRGAILANYAGDRGEDEERPPAFSAGLKAFQNNNTAEAKQNLLQVPADNPYFSSAREMLAWLFFQEKNYTEAARCYESYSKKTPDPAADWRLAQFYLADYSNRKAGFWEKMGEMLDPEKGHRYREDAEKLRLELKKMGVEK